MFLLRYLSIHEDCSTVKLSFPFWSNVITKQDTKNESAHSDILAKIYNDYKEVVFEFCGRDEPVMKLFSRG